MLGITLNSQSRIMRTLFLYIILLSTVLSASAQINVGTKIDIKIAAGKISEALHQEIRAAQAYFILRPADRDHREQIAAILEEVWTVSDIALIDEEQVCELPPSGKYLFFDIDRSITSRARSNSPGPVSTAAERARYRSNPVSRVPIPYFHLHLWLRGAEQPYKKKELAALEEEGQEPYTRYEKRTIARVEVHGYNPYSYQNPNYDAYTENYDIPCQPSPFGSNIYQNMRPGFLKNYLQEINRRLSNKETRFLYAESHLDTELQRLKYDTLFVPEYALDEFRANNAQKKRRNEESLFDDYEFPYKVISSEALSDKILQEETPFYYLSCIRNNYDTAFYSVVNSKTGVIIYSDFKHKRRVFNRLEIEKLSDRIGRS